MDRRRVLGADLDFSDKDVVLSPLPLFHSYALNLSVLCVLAAARANTSWNDFRRSRCWSCCSPGKFTMFPGVPTMFHYLLQRAQEAGVRQARQHAAVYLGGRDHAGDLEPVVRGAFRHHAS